MSIKEVKDKSKPTDDLYLEEEFDIVGRSEKPVFKANFRHIIVILLIILASGAAYGIGRISHYENIIRPIETKSDNVVLPFATASVSDGAPMAKNVSVTKPVTVASSASNDGTVVASKNGTKYYFPWCGGAKRILDANKIYFSSIVDARKAGLTPSSTCKGLQ